MLFITLFLFIGGITYFWVKDLYISQTKASLLQNIDIITFELDKLTNFDNLAHNFKEKLQTRLTVIDENGDIIAESHKNKDTMSNHKYRAEIIQANKEEFGYKIRHSDTLQEDLLYIAKKYTYNDKIIYIRLAKKIKSINAQILSLGLKVFLVVMLFFVAIFYLIYQINTQIQYETKKIANFLRDLASKKKSTYIHSEYSKEFSHITKLLTKISQIIVKREKQKSKYTDKLEASNKQKDDIISAISHEFKNPIAVINGYSQTLLEDTNLNPSIRQKFLQKIYNNGNKLSELIDTLRLSMKLDAGQMKLTFSTLTLNDLLKDAVENLTLSYPKKEVVLHIEENIKAKIDRSLFCVLITNLIENALKYSEDEVHVYLTKNYLAVVDTGIGINKKDLQKITDKFYRVHENSWNNSLGLGLFIVNNIIQLHNFKLEIKSEEKIGSTFKVIF